MPSLHPRYPVLKVPAPARLSAAVAQGLMMPEGRPSGDGNIGLHISHTYLDRRGRITEEGRVPGVSATVKTTIWDCGGNPGPNPSYAARPKSLRYCMGLL